MKHKGCIQMTAEYLQQILNLPEGVEITSVQHDFDRDIVKIIYRTDDEMTPITFRVVEGAMVPTVNFTMTPASTVSFSNEE